MSYNIINTTGDESWIKLSGKLTVHDFLELQTLAKESLEQFGRFLALLELENFQGWSVDDEGWESTSFLKENDLLSKIAVVLGKPLRQINVQFFPPSQRSQAQAWLREPI